MLQLKQLAQLKEQFHLFVDSELEFIDNLVDGEEHELRINIKCDENQDNLNNGDAF